MKRSSFIIDLTSSPTSPYDSTRKEEVKKRFKVKTDHKESRNNNNNSNNVKIDLTTSSIDTELKSGCDDDMTNNNYNNQKYVLPNLVEKNVMKQSEANFQQITEEDIVTLRSSLRQDGDDAVVIFGIMELIQELKINNLGTTFGFHHYDNDTNMSTLDKNQDITHASPSLKSGSSQPYHMMQKDKWSCGYRNTQMLLSALIPNLSNNHLFFTVHHSRNDHISNSSSDQGRKGGYSIIPSLRQLQNYLESCWKDGFDPKGAEHYNRRIVGKTSFIGAVEVSSVLSYLHIDSTVVQFIQCHESRSKLGPFVWAYFTHYGDDDQQQQQQSDFKSDLTMIESPFRSSRKLTSRLLHATEHNEVSPHLTDTIIASETSSHDQPLLPLYLQWEGHSVTIVGIERKLNSQGKTTFDLLIFDPMKNGLDIKDSLSLEVAKLKSLEESQNRTIPAKNNSCKSDDIKCLSKMRLSTSKLSKKDCQIILCTNRQLPKIERERAKIIANALTAAEQAVTRSLTQKGHFA